ncbi:30S ribosomal protein S1, partial [mine drainage metagenome]
HVGDEKEVKVLEIDTERRRISLGMKQCTPNPWEDFAANHKKGARILGKIKSITDFGIFVGLDGGIDGLVHVSDISWDQPGEEVIRNYKKGDEIETVLLSVDPERERISIGIKQLAQDPFTSYLTAHPKGSVVHGRVKSVEAKGAILDLETGIEGYIRATDLARDAVEDARTVLHEGDDIEAHVVSYDRKSRTVGLSVRALEIEEEARVLDDYSKRATNLVPTIGDLFKEQAHESKGP